LPRHTFKHEMEPWHAILAIGVQLNEAKGRGRRTRGGRTHDGRPRMLQSASDVWKALHKAEDSSDWEARVEGQACRSWAMARCMASAGPMARSSGRSDMLWMEAFSLRNEALAVPGELSNPWMVKKTKGETRLGSQNGFVSGVIPSYAYLMVSMSLDSTCPLLDFAPSCSISPRGCMQPEQRWCTMEGTGAHADGAKMVSWRGSRQGRS
jgi:hypothetical protein